MGTFTIPTLDDSHAFLVALMKALFPTADVSEGSFNWLWLRTFAGGVSDNHAHIFNVENDLLPDTASDDMLDRWGGILGVPRKGATPARRDAALRVFGTAASPVPDATQLVHTSGLLFKTNGAATVGAGGYVDVGLVAIDTGARTRLNAGEQLTFSSTPAGLQDTAILQLALNEDGVDEETNGAYQLRVLARLQDPPLGGAQDDYVQWALAQTGIAAAYAYPLRQGIGSVDLAALHAGTGAARVLLAGEVTALKAAIDELRPVSVTFRVLTVTTSAVNIEYTVLPDGDAQSEFDWDDTSAPLVQAWTAGSRTLQFQGGTRPADMVPGMRLCFKPAAGAAGTGAQYVISSLSGADSVVLEQTPDITPAIGDTVYSGGPLVDPIRDAIQALVDSLGTANPDATRYGSWEGNLRPGSIDRVARGILGVLDGTVVAPSSIAAASDPAYPNDATIGLLIAGRILVRRAH